MADVMFVTVCPHCGHPVSAIPVPNDGSSWQAPVLWGYVAQKEHDRQGCQPVLLDPRKEEP